MTNEKLIEILIELKNESLKMNTLHSDDEIMSIMRKYDMLFLGKDFNTIYSIELRHSLEKIFGINLTNEELNKLIPSACASLSMQYEPMAKVEDLSNPVPYCYRIELW